MTWWQRLLNLFHEKPDTEIGTIRADLDVERDRHNRELTRIDDALGLAAEYQRAEEYRRGTA